jgi:hypothetical protein
MVLVIVVILLAIACIVKVMSPQSPREDSRMSSQRYGGNFQERPWQAGSREYQAGQGASCLIVAFALITFLALGLYLGMTLATLAK